MSTTSDQSRTPRADPDSTVAALEDIVVEFPDHSSGKPRSVLKKVSLTVRAGEFLVLVGRSGCGKTTLLNVLAGLVDATSGSASILGKQPRDARRHIGYMFARDALMQWRTAAKNVEYGLELRGVARAERRRSALEYLRLLQLEEAAHLWPWQLSQGMRQRVALARTWALEPELLLMDEPFAALDAQTREVVQYEFLRIWETRRRTVVFVTHDLAEAIAMGDRVVVLGQGEILADIQVPFSRPRELADLTLDAEFQALRRDLRQLL